MNLNQAIVNKIKDKFISLYDNEPLLLRSPGRINLIGEHTDYNNGFVLPAAIDKAIYFAFSLREDDIISLYSIDLEQSFETTTTAKAHSDQHWPDYIVGVVDELSKRGFLTKGFNCVFGGDIPLGAGLSSSAALENGIGFALNELNKFGIAKVDLVKISQAAENNFVGVKCGIMDQFASMMGQADQVIKLDCQSLDFQYEPLETQGYGLLLLDSGVKHSLASSEYNMRRMQCEAGVAMVQVQHPEVNSLRDVTMEMLDVIVLPQDPLIYNRCKYVVEEKTRLLDGCKDLESGNITAFGLKMLATHDGLSKEYEVSCPELDYLVDSVRNNPDVLGARMMGGGFGGCTINIVKNEVLDALATTLEEEYQKHTGLELKSYKVKISDGTSIINNQ